jgi:hypothetical protein
MANNFKDKPKSPPKEAPEPLKKVQLIAPTYYLRKEIQKAMYEFCKHRETTANFNNKFFAKRPDCFDYPNDIAVTAKQGATSFHCSEEIWEDPLKINTNMTPEQYNEIKIGWDFLIDIDSKFLDYSKVAAKLLLKTLESHGVKNYGIKFSGSKGFHIIVPFKSFPEQMYGKETKDHFPEWPRAIAGYIFDQIREPMNEEVLKLTDRERLKEKGELTSENICPKCNKPTIKKKNYKYKCPDISCKTELEGFTKKRVAMLCPGCNARMNIVSEREVDFCEQCKMSTATLEATSSFGGEIRKNEIEKFKTEDTIKSTEDSVDIILVASRHLFRAPYSLHEKTAFASIVIEKEDLDDFKPTDADPLKIKEPKSFMPNVEPGEARELLSQSLNWAEENRPKEIRPTKKFTGESIDLKGLEITQDMFPPIIKKLLKGIKGDGRKRALFILLSFYSALEFPTEYVIEKTAEWNAKNKIPLKEGYLRAQIDWFGKRKVLPPNYTNPIYKEFGITQAPEPGMKNPINYTIKRAMRAKGRAERS